MGLKMSIGVCQWLFLLFSLSTWTMSSTKEARIVCYYTNWSVYRPGDAKFTPQNINPYLCTHLIYAFGGFTKENTLKPFDKYQDIEKGGYAKFTGLKTYNKNLKTMLAIGGWNEGSTRFSPMVANPERRKELVKNAVRFLRQNHFDGLDLDWEYPAFRDGGKSRDRNNYANLVQELREEFERESEKTGRPRLLLTMAVPAGIEYINKGYDVPKLTEYLDWMNILSYDYHSAFEPAVNHHAPLYSLEEDNEYNYDGELNIDYTIKHYLKLGADPSKLVLGIPTYGRSYTLFNPDAYEIGSPADGPGNMGEATRENGYLAYYEICDYVNNQEWEVEQPNPNAMGPYASKDNQWVGYDDENIVRKKAEYVAENGLGGIMFWAIDNDDFRGKCHGKPYPLIEAGKEALLNAYGLTDDNLISPPSKPVKSRTRTRTKPVKPNSVAEEDKTPSPLLARRRNRIKQKEKEPEDTKDVSKTSRRKFRRKSSDENTSTYSSLTVNTPSYTTPAPPATPEMGGAFTCEDEGFFPHPKDCKKYFWCLSGAGDSGIVAHQFTCPAGLYFNKAADSCDYTQNVLCNKKLQKAKTTTSAVTAKGSDGSTSTTPVSVFVSTTRAPPKITAATSKTTVKLTSSTEAYKEEYEYDDEEEEEEEEDSLNPSKISKKDSEEDPQVIKELIDLIKKAGGLEELERQFKARNYSAATSLNSSGAGDATTPTSFDKSLYERVLNKALQSSVNKKKTYTGIRNSRGPQSEGIKDAVEEKTERGKLHYTSITRNRPTTSSTSTEATTAADGQRQRKNFELEYVNIRRNRFGSTTESNEKDSTLDRNRILGEVDSESDEDDEEETVGSREPVKSTFTPQYVNIRRQRPSSTEAASTSKYVEIRRGTTPADVADETTEHETSKYKTIRRGTTTTGSTVEETTTDGFRLQSRRGTTVTTTATDNTTEPTKSSTPPVTESITSTQSPTRAETTESTTTTTTTTTPIPSTAQSETTTTQQPLKVSQFNPKFRLRTKTETVTETTEPARARGGTRFRSGPDSVQIQTQQTADQQASKAPVQPKRRIATTERYVDESRNYRPSEIADLSSLTAVDFDNLKEFAPSPNHRRRRPTRPSTTTSTTEQLEDSLKTGSRTLPLARKLISGTVFGKSRRVEDPETGKVRGYRTTREPSITPSTVSTSTVRTRKIIRRFRPTTSTTTSKVVEDLEEEPKQKLFNQKHPQLFPLQENDVNEETDDSYEDNVNDEEENIKLSESNIRENSDINSFGAELKSELHDKSDIFQKGRFGFKNEPDSSGKSPSTEPTTFARTRKIIRRLSTTTTTTTPSTEPSIHPETNLNRKRKIIRRLRPVTKLNQIFSTEEKPDGTRNETDEDASKRVFRPHFGNAEATTEADSEDHHDNNETSSEEPAPERQRTRLRPYLKQRTQTTDKTVESSEEEVHNDAENKTALTNVEPTVTKSRANLRLRLYQKQPTRVKQVEVEEEDSTNATELPRTRNNSRFRLYQRQPPRTSEEKKIETVEPEEQIVTLPPTDLPTEEDNTETTSTEANEDEIKTDSTETNEETTTEFFEETSPSSSTTEAPTTRNNKFRRPQDRPSFSRQRFTHRAESTTASSSFSPRSRTFSRTTESNIPEENASRKPQYSRYKYRKSTTSTSPSSTTPVSSTTEESNVVTKSVEDNEVTDESESKTTVEESVYTTATVTEGNIVSTTSEGDETSSEFGLEITTESIVTTMHDEDVTEKVSETTTESTYETVITPDSAKVTTSTTNEVVTATPDTSSASTATVKNVLKLPSLRPKFVPGKYKSSAETTTKIPTISTTKRFGKYLNRFEKHDAENSTEVAQRSTPLPLNKLLYRYGGQREESEENDEEATTKKTNKPHFAKKPTTKAANNPIFARTTSTIPPDLDTEALKLRNKQLFSQRKPTEPTTKPSTDLETTTELLTTLHHVFAAVDDDVKATTESMSTSKLERLVEVNRIVQVNTKDAKNHNVQRQESPREQVDPIVNKIGEVSRVTVIKVVDTDGSVMNGTDSTENEIKPEDSIKSSVDAIIHAAKIEEVPGGGKVNISNVLMEINSPHGHREERKFEIYGGSKINYNSPDISHQGKAEIIDGISHINIITPRPVYYTEASTIALEGLFLTKKPSAENSLFDRNTEEVLETENSRFVNVRVLRPDGDSRNGVRGDTRVVPIKILKQDDEEVTMKAKVVELRPSTTLDKIKIVPIRVEMTKRVGVEAGGKDSTAPT